MPKKKSTKQRKVKQKTAPKTTNAPPPPNSKSEANCDEDEHAAIWWTVYERRDFLRAKIAKWERTEKDDLATKEERLAVLRKLLYDIEELIRCAESEQLTILKRWHADATDDQLESWVKFLPLPPPENWQAEWRHLSTVTLDLPQSVVGGSEPKRPKQRHHILWSLIRKAKSETDGSTPDVHTWLKAQARKRTPPLTGVDDDGAILYESIRHPGKRLTYDALDKLLKRAHNQQ